MPEQAHAEDLVWIADALGQLENGYYPRLRPLTM